MRTYLVMRWDAPLVSFGAPAVDNHGVIQRVPALSMLAGLVANALGYDHADAETTTRLQERLCFGARCDVAGTRLTDFHTVYLGHAHLAAGWTTHGTPEGRAGANSEETHIRYRDYFVDAAYTLVVALDPADESPTLDEVERALREPERPLFIGRKCCLPSVPMAAGRVEAASIREALERAPLPPERARTLKEGPFDAWWPAANALEGDDETSRLVPVTDERDWVNQIHGGRRFWREGLVEVTRG